MMIWQICRDFSAIFTPGRAVDTGLNVMVLFIISSLMVTCTIMRPPCSTLKIAARLAAADSLHVRTVGRRSGNVLQDDRVPEIG